MRTNAEAPVVQKAKAAAVENFIVDCWLVGWVGGLVGCADPVVGIVSLEKAFELERRWIEPSVGSN